MTRRKARERAVQFLFQMDFNRCDPEAALALFWNETGVDKTLRSFADDLIQGVLEHKDSLDAKISEYSEHWQIKRMGGVDRNILRVALFEMFHRPDIPPVVSINEAIDIAKRFGCNDSGKFVNGVLDRATADLNRPIREPASPD